MPTGWTGYALVRLLDSCVYVHLSSVNNTPSLTFLFSRCTRKEKCERSSEPRRFASDIKQCVRLSVHPNNISVSQFSVTVSGNTLLFTLLWPPDNNDQGTKCHDCQVSKIGKFGFLIKEQIPKLMAVPYPISDFLSSTINLILPLALIPPRLC